MGEHNVGQTLDVAVTAHSDSAKFNTPLVTETFQRILPFLEESRTLKTELHYFITGPSSSQFKQHVLAKTNLYLAGLLQEDSVLGDSRAL